MYNDFIESCENSEPTPGMSKPFDKDKSIDLLVQHNNPFFRQGTNVQKFATINYRDFDTLLYSLFFQYNHL